MKTSSWNVQTHVAKIPPKIASTPAIQPGRLSRRRQKRESKLAKYEATSGATKMPPNGYIRAMWPNYTCRGKVFPDIGYYAPNREIAFHGCSGPRGDSRLGSGGGQRSKTFRGMEAIRVAWPNL